MENNTSNIVTLRDLEEYVEEEEKLAAAAKAVLGPSESNTCTYEKGYMKRQALYSCLTCISDPASESQGAVCLPCAEHCHDDHNLVELYTKRNVRCDCGNSKFPTSFKCKLNPCKSELNTGNTYNHNYRGLYCTCNRPYPEEEDTDVCDDSAGEEGKQVPAVSDAAGAGTGSEVGEEKCNEEEEEDEMIQCIICEDWFHVKHLMVSGGVSEVRPRQVPSSEHPQLEGITCPACMTACPLLYRYTHLMINNDAGEAPSEPQQQQQQGDCLLATLPPAAQGSGGAAAGYWVHGWRQRLCTCHQCKVAYERAGVPYLLDPADLLSTYEAGGGSRQADEVAAGSRKREHNHHAGEPAGMADGAVGAQEHRNDDEDTLNTFLAKCDRVVQVEMISGYNDMKESLVEYLKKFAESGKVVEAGDIETFFTELQQERKRQRLVPSYTCK